MKQVIQDMSSGRTSVMEVPAPIRKPGNLLVATEASLVSSGTERMIVEFAKKNWIEKAKVRPDLAAKAVQKVFQEGPAVAWQQAQSRLNQPFPTGYSLAGTVVESDANNTEFQVGDRVACAGVPHAELVSVPANLCVKRGEVSAEEASFIALGAIALHGLRLGRPQVGENIAVIGLGLVGQLCAQLAKISGGRVFGVDIDPERCRLASSLGADAAVERKDAEAAAATFTQGKGFDLVLIAADTPSSDPVELAARICRDRACVVAIGAVGMDLPRKIYYEKEIDFRVSRSYGPGRYDPEYEEEGRDYPIGYVRWTEKRNMEAFLEFVAHGKVNTKDLISHRFPIQDGIKAYEIVAGDRAVRSLGVVLNYPESKTRNSRRIESSVRSDSQQKGRPQSLVSVGVLGAGQFASLVLLPILKRNRVVRKVGITSAGGLTAKACADRFEFSYCATDEGEVLADPQINTIIITTRHDRHASQVVQALRAGKNIFVEKPLCLNLSELESIESAYEDARKMAQNSGSNSPLLMVGFNRRFAPLALRLKEFFREVREPKFISYRFNAGYLPLSHWSQKADQGGRILGEACHAIDMAQWLCASKPQRVKATPLPDGGRYNRDNVLLSIEFEDASVASIAYVSNGDKTAGKEYVEIHAGGRSGILNDFRQLSLTTNGKTQTCRSWLSQDKGHQNEIDGFVEAIHTGTQSPIPYPELLISTRTALAAVESLATGRSVDIAG